MAPRKSLARSWFVDNTPCYLLSAACMLGGCLALTNSLSWNPIRLQRLLMLMMALNLYEFLLVALGLYLIVVRRLRRDGTILLVLEAFFLVDVTFLDMEIYASDVRVGAIVNAIVMVLAIVKLAAIFRCFGVPLTSGAFLLVTTEMAALLALAVAIGGYDRHVASLGARMRAQLLLPVLAVLMSVSFPSSLVFPAAPGAISIGMSPLRLALLATALVYFHGFWLHRHVYFA